MNKKDLLRWVVDTPVNASKLPPDALVVQTPTAVATVQGEWAERVAAEYDKVKQLNDEE